VVDFLVGLGREAIIFEGETMSHFTSRTRGEHELRRETDS
jgi:hypothetical protein